MNKARYCLSLSADDEAIWKRGCNMGYVTKQIQETLNKSGSVG